MFDLSACWTVAAGFPTSGATSFTSGEMDCGGQSPENRYAMALKFMLASVLPIESSEMYASNPLDKTTAGN
jgi:hypothetical protein